MRAGYRYLVSMLLLLGVVCSTFGSPCSAAYNRYFRYLGNYGGDRFTSWFTDEVSGIANDSGNWYIAQGTNDRSSITLWKIPARCRLDSWDALRVPEARVHSEAYAHVGDIDVDEEHGRLFAPIEWKKSHYVAVFSTADLALLGTQPTADSISCALGPDEKGRKSVLYIPTGDTIARYTVDWDNIKENGSFLQPCAGGDLVLTKAGQPYHFAGGIQGLDFSPDGHVLYCVVGENDPYEPGWGVQVFELPYEDWASGPCRGVWIRGSSPNGGLFECHVGASIDLTYEEPEAATVWDSNTDELGFPGMAGQLYVAIRDNNWAGFEDDELILKEYTNTIYVDAAGTGAEKGTLREPFHRVGAAISLIDSMNWDTGLIMRVRPGLYEEPVLLAEPVLLQAPWGSAAVGSAGRVLVTPAGALGVRLGGRIHVK